MKAALESNVPCADHRFPTCVPVLPAPPLKKRTPSIANGVLEKNRTPSSTSFGSATLATEGCVPAKMLPPAILDTATSGPQPLFPVQVALVVAGCSAAWSVAVIVSVPVSVPV